MHQILSTFQTYFSKPLLYYLQLNKKKKGTFVKLGFQPFNPLLNLKPFELPVNLHLVKFKMFRQMKIINLFYIRMCLFIFLLSLILLYLIYVPLTIHPLTIYPLSIYLIYLSSIYLSSIYLSSIYQYCIYLSI